MRIAIPFEAYIAERAMENDISVVLAAYIALYTAKMPGYGGKRLCRLDFIAQSAM